MDKPEWQMTGREQLAELWSRGLTQREMSEHTGIPKNVVGRIVRSDPERFPPRRVKRATAAPRQGTQLKCGHWFRSPVSPPGSGERVWCRTCDAATYVGTPER
ncbi:helix-turn-helix transcriptional regulator [Actinoplanes sp. LDG1-06]|uniref:Helix-turn-helix transcriptional regulator n=1 Tax=Paractinoplanes ovalisporus TaxID=2810368 RepID=A0ABS2AMX2_9ACTN|nr:helix-turn-helix transcriptional regulator [Actinoplanes ovalisporus]MBM2621197.1 helix-turn-helix transcriptional regulator [Actinoplanes ovalisporus]